MTQQLLVFGGQGMSGGYWFPLLAVLDSLGVMAGSWNGRRWSFIVIASGSVLTLLAVIALAVLGVRRRVAPWRHFEAQNANLNREGRQERED